jgi:hypothetical protein
MDVCGGKFGKRARVSNIFSLDILGTSSPFKTRTREWLNLKHFKNDLIRLFKNFNDFINLNIGLAGNIVRNNNYYSLFK